MTRSSSSSRRTPGDLSDRKAAVRAVRHAPQQVRIIGGDWKRTPLPVVTADGLRPTPDRVRETLFNWLGQQLTGAHCLDLFAGTGALGFEAASRGAARVLMVERNARAAAQLRDVKAKLHAASIEIAEADALRLGNALAPQSFDLVFLDPPFDGDLLAKALPLAARLARADGALYVEAPESLVADGEQAQGQRQGQGEAQGEQAQEAAAAPLLMRVYLALHADGWRVVRHGRAGAVHYHLLRRETDE